MAFKQPFAILLFAAIALLAGCSHHPDQRLTEIDSIIENAPDSAYTLLEKLDSATLDDDDLPYYALLYTQAQIKCGENVTSDSIISIAYSHYITQEDSELKKRACFYNAQVAYNARRYHTAMRDILNAYDIAKAGNDSYWIAKSAEMISDILFDTYNISESLPYEYEAIDQYEKAGKILNHRYTICDLATTYVHLKKYKAALNLLDSLKTVIINEQPVDSNLLTYLNRTVPSALYYNGKFDELEKFLAETDMPKSSIDKVTLSYAKANFLNNAQQLDSASQIISFASNIAEDDRQKIVMLYPAYNNAFKRGDYKKAAELADSLLIMQNKLLSYVLKESATAAISDYYTAKSELFKKEADLKSKIIIFIVFAAVATIIILIIVYRIKLKSRLIELEENTMQLISLRKDFLKESDENRTLTMQLSQKEENADLLKHKLKNISEINLKKNEVIESLFKEKWTTLNMLCNQYFDIFENERSRISVLNNIDKELKKLRSPKNLKEIEASVNIYMGNIMAMLRTECPDFKEEDYSFLTLVYAGFSARAVSIFLGIKYKFYYLKKSRLSKKILNSKAPHRDTFISKLR